MRAALLVLALLAGCRGSTELVLVLSTDLTVPSEADTLSIVVAPAAGGQPLFSHSYLLPAEARLPASLDLSDPDGSAPTIAITAQLQHAGSVVVERRAVLPFVRGHALELHLPLERSCVGSSCAGDLTCAAGQCVAVQIDPQTLPAVRGNPLAPLPDQGGPPADMATTSIPDGGCPPALPPKVAIGCTLYSFADGHLPLGATLNQAPDVTVAYECGMLHVSLPPGRHDFTPNDNTFVLYTPSLLTTFQLSARFHDRLPEPGTFAGIAAYSSPTEYLQMEAGPEDASGGDTEVAFTASDQVTPIAGSTSTSAFTHHFILSRSAAGLDSSTYDLIADEVPLITDFTTTLPRAQQPIFYAGNHAPAMDVYVEYVMVCAP